MKKAQDEAAQYRQDKTDAENKLHAAEDQIKKNKAKIGEMQKTIDDLNVKIQGLIQSGGKTGPENMGTTTTQKIDCTVVEVKKGEGFTLVALDKGSKAGLAVGTKLYVWNSKESYKGKITIVEVKDSSSVARIEWQAEGKEIAAGDTATVQNF